MYLLKKVIQIREKSHPDHEKPFLEHLEDLRIMITRIVVTLLIAMIVCFAYHTKIMAFFRKPVDEVLVNQMAATLPPDREVARPLTTDIWKEALKIEHTASALSVEQREIYFRFLKNDDMVFHAKSVALVRASMTLPEARRADFVGALNESPDLKKQINALLKTKPGTERLLRGDLTMMSSLKPTEGFMLSMKLAFVAGIVVSFPLLLLYILKFVLPGLHSHEKRVLWPAMAVGFGLFLFGAAFAYYLVLPRALLFFYTWSGQMGISNDWRIGEYISFATQFTVLFGLSFELPVVVMVFVKLGLLTYDTMSRTRAYAVVGIFVTAAVLTPTPDIATMLLMAMPMIILYEICIWLAYFDQKKARLAEEQEARESEERSAAAAAAASAAAAARWERETCDQSVLLETAAGEAAAGHPDDEHAVESGDDGWSGQEVDADFHEYPEIPGQGHEIPADDGGAVLEESPPCENSQDQPGSDDDSVKKPSDS
jgi:sec-independent protein translocase protein TatC